MQATVDLSWAAAQAKVDAIEQVRAAQAHQTKVEGAGEDVLAVKERLVDLDRRRNQLREAIASFRRRDRQAAGDKPGAVPAAGVKAGAANNTPSGSTPAKEPKHWVSFGDFFIKMPEPKVRTLLKADYDSLGDQIEGLRSTIHERTDALLGMEQGDEGREQSARFTRLKPLSRADLKMLDE